MGLLFRNLMVMLAQSHTPRGKKVETVVSVQKDDEIMHSP